MFIGKLVDYRINVAFFIVLYSRLKIMGGNDCYLIIVFLIIVNYLCLFSNLYFMLILFLFIFYRVNVFNWFSDGFFWLNMVF